MSAALGEDGLFISGGVSAPWRFESIVQDEGGALLIGPDVISLALKGETRLRSRRRGRREPPTRSRRLARLSKKACRGSSPSLAP